MAYCRVWPRPSRHGYRRRCARSRVPGMPCAGRSGFRRAAVAPAEPVRRPVQRPPNAAARQRAFRDKGAFRRKGPAAETAAGRGARGRAATCRGRNRVAGALLSEHGRANALDVRGMKLANGRSIGLTDRNVPRGLRETVLHSVCARFMTVLGPGSDGYHEDHIHLDLMERHNNYKICQWNVWDPLPPIAPLMPAERPADAPPREVASRKDEGHDD